MKSGKYEPAACCIDLELNPKINATRPILISVSRLSAHGSAIKRGGTAVISSLTLHVCIQWLLQVDIIFVEIC